MKEKILNIPNTITASRILITFFVVYAIIAKYNIMTIAIAFTVGMITDFFDGQIARRWKMTTEFGRKFDMFADRFLMIGTVIAFLISYQGIMTSVHWIQVCLIMSREIFSAPFAIYAYLSKKSTTPHAKFIGKLTTFLQGVSFPLVILGIFYEQFAFSGYFAVATGLVGVMSGMQYMKDMNETKHK